MKKLKEISLYGVALVCKEYGNLLWFKQFSQIDKKQHVVWVEDKLKEGGGSRYVNFEEAKNIARQINAAKVIKCAETFEIME